MVMADEEPRNTSEGIQYSCHSLYMTPNSSRKLICSNEPTAAYCPYGSEIEILDDPELRIINSAIYVKPLRNDDKIEKNDSSSAERMDCDVTKIHEMTSHIGRSQSLTSTSSFVSLPKGTQSMTKFERRCRIDDDSERSDDTYIFDDRRRHVISASNISASVSTFSSDHQFSSLTGLPKKLAHEEWMKNKRLEAARRKKEAEQLEAMEKEKNERLAREKEEREHREQINFVLWSERKKQEEERKRKMEVKRLALVKQLKELNEEALISKEMSLREWAAKKNEAERTQREQLKQKIQQMEEYKKKRMEESTKAFEKWREISKNKSKPATQGLLPHQRAIPAYVNPKPWIVEN